MRKTAFFYGKILVFVMLLGTLLAAILWRAGKGENPFYGTAWSLLPPVVSIVLALLTHEVYSSLFIGITVGGLLVSNFSIAKTVTHVFNDGILATLSDTEKDSILFFVVLLGAVVVLVQLSGGAEAFGRFMGKRIKSRQGLQLMTVLLGVFFFIDDGFSCMTTGSVMRPVCDKNRVSRAKLSYLIDATAAPICIIAPVSSWAAAVIGYLGAENGMKTFLYAIPFNFYALLTLVMMLCLVVFRLDYGPMKREEDAACQTEREGGEAPKGNDGVLDMLLPIVVLILGCIAGMVYTGGFFGGVPFAAAVSNSNPPLGFIYGSAFTIVFTVLFYTVRRRVAFREMMTCLPKGFNLMTAPMLILILAWTLKFTTAELGVRVFMEGLIAGFGAGLQKFFPAAVFLIAALISFATGTSWGTFGILIPIVVEIFPAGQMLSVVCISACLAGAVFGDHCSPISDTTIMASAGAQCDHVVHVSTQLPYALTVAAVSLVSYLAAGFLPNAFVVLPLSVLLMVGTLWAIRLIRNKKEARTP